MPNPPLSKSDYEEPCCPLKKPTNVTPIATGRMIEKLDEYLNRRDYDAAERHLKYWLAEAEAGNDARGRLTVLNEQIGLYYKTGKEDECLRAIEDALSLADEIGVDRTITMGTTLVNAAAGYKAFGREKEALPLYEKARVLYEEALAPADARLGGLYNNMALTVAALGDYPRASDLFTRALAVMAQNEHGEGEMAVTYCNLADLAAMEHGVEQAEEQIREYLTTAERLLNTESLPKNGYYAFLCEKCAPTFGYYGFFLTEKELTRRAEEIYARS